jgi:hypothetical protein
VDIASQQPTRGQGANKYCSSMYQHVPF